MLSVKRILTFLLAILLILGLAGCGKTNEKNDNSDSDKKEQNSSENNNESDTTLKIDNTVFSYLNKTLDEIVELFGECKETTWYSGYIHNYGDYWFVFDTFEEQPSGNVYSVFCKLDNIIDNIKSDVGINELDALFGTKGDLFFDEHDGIYRLKYLYDNINIYIDALNEENDSDNINIIKTAHTEIYFDN